MLTSIRASMCHLLFYTRWRTPPGEGQELEDQKVPLERVILFSLWVKGQLLRRVQNLRHLASVVDNVGEAGRVEVRHGNPGAHRAGAGIRGRSEINISHFVKIKKVDWMPSPLIRQRGLMRLITRVLASHGWFVVDEAEFGLILFLQTGGPRWSFALFHHYQLNLSWIRSIVSPPSLKMLSFRGDRFNFLTSSRLRSQTCVPTCRQRSATESRRNEDGDDTEMSIQRDVITACRDERAGPPQLISGDSKHQWRKPGANNQVRGIKTLLKR